VPWADVLADNRGGDGVFIPNQVPGVYEVRFTEGGRDERVYIGKAADLRLRIRQGLVKGKLPHSEGKRIRQQEDVSRLAIRWAVTDRPSAAEEELHRAYRTTFGHLPLYTQNT
jgi:excinuclease UvrABC nuclease subunit